VVSDRIPDYAVRARNGGRSAQVIQIDSSKHALIMAVSAFVCGVCVLASLILLRVSHDDLVDVQDQYQKERNHVIELEARLKILGDELQELKRHE
jgi:hypothetical protein